MRRAAPSGWELVGPLSDPWEHVSAWGAQVEGGGSPEDEAPSETGLPCPADPRTGGHSDNGGSPNGGRNRALLD